MPTATYLDEPQQPRARHWSKPEPPSAEDLAAKAAQTVRARFNRLETACKNRALAIVAPVGAPASLVDAIGEHNSRISKHTTAIESLVSAAAAMGAAVGDPKSKGTAIAVQAERTRLTQYDLIRERLAIIEDRRPLLSGILAWTEKRLPELEADVDRVKKKVAAALERAGLGIKQAPHMAAIAGGPPIYDVNPDAAAHQFNSRIAQSADVRAASALPEEIRQLQVRMREALAVIDDDLDAATEALHDAWRLVAGAF